MNGKNEEREVGVSLIQQLLLDTYFDLHYLLDLKLTAAQYKIYLFEMILLCCKELSAKKAKNMNRSATAKNGKPKLQLKGRIFMQNVTETISLQKPGKAYNLGHGCCL